MKAACITILLGLSLLGCRSNRGQELLERELRHQEDQIYHLEGKLRSAEDMIAALEQETHSYRDGSTRIVAPADKPYSRSDSWRDRPSHDSSPSPSDRSRSMDELKPPEIKLEGAEQAPPFRGLPEFSPPNPSKPEGENPGPVLPPRTPAQPTASAKSPSDAERVATPTLDEIDDFQVTSITLNRDLTGPWNADGVAGIEGVRVVIEPRTASGHVVPVPGKVSIVLMDPAIEGSAGRVARWDFNLKETADYFGRVASGGMQFELRWPQRPPTHPLATLHVRYTAGDGRKLDAELPINLASGATPSEAQPAPSSGTQVRTTSPSVPPAARTWTKSKQPAPTRPLTPRIQTEPVTDAAVPRATIRDARVPDDRAPQREAAIPTDPRSARRPEWAPYR